MFIASSLEQLDIIISKLVPYKFTLNSMAGKGKLEHLKLIAQKGESHKLQEIYERDNLRYIDNYKNYLIKTKKSIKVFDSDCSRNEFENLHGYFFNANFKP